MKRIITDKELDFIYGNEHLKRAIQVAQASNQSLLIIGNKRTQAKEIRLNFAIEVSKNAFVDIKTWQKCPCGNFEDPEMDCICEIEDIKKHLLTKPVCDMEIEITKPHFNKLKDRFKKEYKFEKTSLDLLETAYRTCSLSPKELITIIRRAEAIQTMENEAYTTKKDEIKPVSIAESLQYRPKK